MARIGGRGGMRPHRFTMGRRARSPIAIRPLIELHLIQQNF